MQSSSTTVVTWALRHTEAIPAEDVFNIGPIADDIGHQTSFRDDSREVVAMADIKPGGKYRSVVKLQIRFERQAPDDTRYAQGTGWLVRDDLLVTAGHCVYDHSYNLGKASEVKAYVGYNGKASLQTPYVQFRKGKKVATTQEWVFSSTNRPKDVSFIQLESPFQAIVPIKWAPTPTRGTLMLGVVGYPGDKTLNGEQGAQMYEQYKEISFDLPGTFLNMLEYTISTFAGQSGSPVLMQGQNTSIGAHVYGYGSKNSASVIRGHYGNIYEAFFDSFSSSNPAVVINQSGGIKYLRSDQAPEDQLTEQSLSSAEDFWSTFKKVAEIGATVGNSVLSAGSPIMGPVVGPIAAAAGTAIGIAGKLVASHAASDLGPGPDYRAYASRAVLAEAALQTVLKMNPESLRRYEITQAMLKSYTSDKTQVPAITKAICPSLVDAALRIAVSSTKSAPEVKDFPHIPLPLATESNLNSNADDFADGLANAAQGPGREEGFFSVISAIAKVAVKVVPPVIGGIMNLVNGGESAMVGKPTHEGFTEHLETIVHRSLMGEAALKALMDIPPSAMKEEGFFGDMLDTVKSIGATVIKVAPSVIRTVVPIVQALSQSSGGESSLTSPPPGTLVPTEPDAGTNLVPKKSVADLLSEMSPKELEHLEGATGTSTNKGSMNMVRINLAQVPAEPWPENEDGHFVAPDNLPKNMDGLFMAPGPLEEQSNFISHG